MLNDQDVAYFNARANDERAMSATATEEPVASVHAEMAERYEQLARADQPRRPVLHIVTASPST